MNLEDVKHEIVMMDGHKYEVIALDKPMDLTEENNGIETEMTHVIKGFDEDLYVIVEPAEGSSTFYFGYKVIGTGLLLSVSDEQVHNTAVSVLEELADR